MAAKPKNVSVTYIGTSDDPTTQTITEGGVTFVKGRAETVASDHPWLDRFSTNPTFRVGEGDVEGTDDDIDAVKAELDKRGVQYDPNWSDDELRAKLAEVVGTGQQS